MRQPTKKCYDCNHCEMCAWIKEVEEQGCEFFDNGNKWIPCSERLPEDNVPVNITWINREPVFYYAEIKDVPFTATGVYFKGKWYWYSSTVEDYLAEYGRAEWDEIEEAMHNSIEVVAWMPLPAPYGGESNG